MEVIDKCEMFKGDDPEGDFVFQHTMLVLWSKEDDRYFHARVPKRGLLQNEKLGIDELELEGLREIPMSEDAWPPFNPRFTQAPTPLPQDTFIKRPCLLGCDFTPRESPDGAGKVMDLTLAEVEVCEFLMRHPHPNVAQYLGCLVEDGRIKGLCFVKYEMTLWDWRKKKRRDGNPILTTEEREACLESIKEGVRHLHELGLVHNDLNPHNIMMDGSGKPVIIDFDSCGRQGERIGQKGGTFEWSMERITHSQCENDFYAISKLRDWLMGTAQEQGSPRHAENKEPAAATATADTTAATHTTARSTARTKSPISGPSSNAVIQPEKMQSFKVW